MIRFIDMFCGIGGFRLGLQQAEEELVHTRSDIKAEEVALYGNTTATEGGNDASIVSIGEVFRCVRANDNDRYACRIYRKHWNDGTLHEGDIRTVDVDAIPEHDLLCAGFPCQSFSIAGKRRGFEDTRGTLFFEICRVIRAKRPGYLWLENVKGLLSHDEGRTFQTIIGTLDELGYDCQWQVLNSKDFGVPQNRERVFIIGHFRGKPRPKVFPIGEANEVYPESDGEISHAIDSNYHKGWLDNQQRTMIIQAGHRAKGKPRLYEGEIPAMTQNYGTGGQNVPLAAKRWPLRYLDRNQKNIEGDYGFAVDGSGTWGIKEGMNIRRLTPLECERLQGFPDGWTKGISDTQRYKCLGNAVTVNVIEAIGKQLLGEIIKGGMKDEGNT